MRTRTCLLVGFVLVATGSLLYVLHTSNINAQHSTDGTMERMKRLTGKVWDSFKAWCGRCPDIGNVVSPIQLTIGKSISARSVRLPHPIIGDKSRDTTNSRRFSRFRCLGDDNSIKGYQERICVFENVCYKIATEEFFFYSRPEIPLRPILFDADHGEKFDFTEGDHGFVALQQTLDMGLNQHNTWAPKIALEDTPMIAAPGTAVVLPDLHALYSHWAGDDNLGHMLWEELANVWYAMIRMNVYDENVVLMHGPYEPLPQRPRSIKYRKAFLPAITKSQPVTMKDYLRNISANSSRERGTNVEYVCFDQLLAGGAMRRFMPRIAWHNQGHEPLFYSLRNRILEHHGFDTNALPTEHRIVITNKTASNWFQDIDKNMKQYRGIVNLQEVVDFVKQQYPTVKVHVIEWQYMSVRDQLALLQSTTVLVTPAGGVGMLIPFMPDGAHVIPMDYLENSNWWIFGTKVGQSVSMEAPFWNHWPHLKKQYYQVFSKDQLRSNNPDKPLDDSIMFRDMASVVVDVNRLGNLIDGAFEDMEP